MFSINRNGRLSFANPRQGVLYWVNTGRKCTHRARAASTCWHQYGFPWLPISPPTSDLGWSWESATWSLSKLGRQSHGGRHTTASSQECWSFFLICICVQLCSSRGAPSHGQYFISYVCSTKLCSDHSSIQCVRVSSCLKCKIQTCRVGNYPSLCYFLFALSERCTTTNIGEHSSALHVCYNTNGYHYPSTAVTSAQTLAFVTLHLKITRTLQKEPSPY